MATELRKPRHSRIDTDVPWHERPDVFPKGRRCAGDGCSTVLNQFHEGPHCYACESRVAGREVEEEQVEFLDMLRTTRQEGLQGWAEVLERQAA